MVHKEHWKDEPDEHDYPAARNYLGLVTTDENAQAFATALALVPIVRRYAKDLLRASQLPALSDKNYHVAKDLRKVGKGQRLSPVLLVAGDFSTDTPLTIADGYHRICASYQLDEDALIPCRIIHVGEVPYVTAGRGKTPGGQEKAPGSRKRASTPRTGQPRTSRPRPA
jgi:hypothetical protein